MSATSVAFEPTPAAARAFADALRAQRVSAARDVA